MPRKVELPKGKIGPQFVKKVLPWVEVYWHTHKRYPSDIALSDHFGFSALDLERLHASKFYLACLKERGITHEPKYFTPEQVAAITLITNVYDTRSNVAKLAALGVTPEQYNGWMQNPEFKAELQRRAEDILDNIFPDAQAALAKQVTKGNIPALKFYYEITGRAQSPETVNLKLTMIRVIEAVQKHVKDPAILQAIAQEINAVEPTIEPPVAALPSQPSSLKAMHQKHLETINEHYNN